jgi:hypothetical protein
MVSLMIYSPGALPMLAVGWGGLLLVGLVEFFVFFQLTKLKSDPKEFESLVQAQKTVSLDKDHAHMLSDLSDLTDICLLSNRPDLADNVSKLAMTHADLPQIGDRQKHAD